MNKVEKRMRHVLGALGGIAVVLMAIGNAHPTLAAGAIAIENRSSSKIKVVGEGGSAILEPGSPPTTVDFEGGKDVGIDAKIWWTSNPRELCQLFVPWDRTVVVSGTTYIKCRSE